MQQVQQYQPIPVQQLQQMPVVGMVPMRTEPLRMMQCNIYVSNLPVTMTEEQVREFFSHCGRILGVRMKTDHTTNEFKGFCFVDFSSLSGALRALALNGKMYDGRRVKICISRETPIPVEFVRAAELVSEPYFGDAIAQGAAGPIRPEGSRYSVSIYGLRDGLTDEDIKALVKKVLEDDCEVKLLFTPSGEFKHCGFINFSNADAQQRALAARQITDGTTTLLVRPQK